MPAARIAGARAGEDKAFYRRDREEKREEEKIAKKKISRRIVCGSGRSVGFFLSGNLR
jgi:hypothetical protein